MIMDNISEFHLYISKFENLVNSSYQNSTRKKNKKQNNINNIYTELLEIFLRLKEINFNLNNVAETQRIETQNQKQTLDSLNLSIESLKYEKAHLTKEISLCQDFTSSLPEDQLISMIDFHTVNPLIDTNIDQHELHIKRLNFELSQRKQFVKEIEELQLKKISLENVSNNKLNFLSHIPQHLDNILAESLHIQTTLQKMGWVNINPHAKYLPSPLFRLFCNATNLSLSDPMLSVNINGYPHQIASEIDFNDFEDFHPLYISISYHHLSLDFFFHKSSKVFVSSNEPYILSSFSLLEREIEINKDLYPSQYGFPYLWAQNICGLNNSYSSLTFSTLIYKLFSRYQVNQNLSDQISSLTHNGSDTLNNLVSYSIFPIRPKCRIIEFHEYTPKENEISSLFFSQPASYFQCTFHRHNFELLAIIQIPDEYPEIPPTWRLKLSRLPSFNDRWNNYDLVEKTADKQALNAVTTHPYPFVNSLFDLENEMNYSTTSLALEGVKALMGQNISPDFLISYLLRKLQYDFDILVDGEKNETKLHQGSLFGRSYRGRDRRLPYKLQSESNQFLFDQRY